MGQKKALVAWGGWEGHAPQESSEITRTMLENNHFAVDVVEGNKAFRDPDSSRYDLILPVITMSTIEKEEVENFARRLKKELDWPASMAACATPSATAWNINS